MRDYEPRLKELSEIEDGWYWDDEGKAPNDAAIANVKKFFEHFRLYPIIEGGIQLEVSLNDEWCLDIEFKNDGSIETLAMDLKSP